MLGYGAAQSLLFWWKRKHKRTYELVRLLVWLAYEQAALCSISLTVEHAGYTARPVARAAYCQRALPLLAIPGSLVLLHGKHRLHAMAVHAATHTADHAAPGAPWRPGTKGCSKGLLYGCLRTLHAVTLQRVGTCLTYPASGHLFCCIDIHELLPPARNHTHACNADTVCHGLTCAVGRKAGRV